MKECLWILGILGIATELLLTASNQKTWNKNTCYRLKCLAIPAIKKKLVFGGQPNRKNISRDQTELSYCDGHVLLLLFHFLKMIKQIIKQITACYNGKS